MATYTHQIAMTIITRMTNRTGQPVLAQSSCGVNDMHLAPLVDPEGDLQRELGGHRSALFLVWIEAPLPRRLEHGVVEDLRASVERDVRGDSRRIDLELHVARLLVDAERLGCSG